jgi:hypothetical protein
MSICYWAVRGYGIEIKEEMFDTDKLKKNPILADLEDDEFEDALIEPGLFQEVIKNASPYLDFGDSGSMDTGKFLMYFSNNPWDMSKEEKTLTKEEIEDQIVNFLAKYLKDEYTEEWIRENIDDISVGGAG